MGERLSKTPLTGRGERTREVLLRAAEDEFWDKGYLATRVADIAARAAMSHGSFYTYFDSKDAVVWALAADLHDRVVASTSGVTADAGGDEVRAIELANRRYLEFYVANRKAMHLMEEVSAFDPKMRAARRKTLFTFAERNARRLRHLQADGRADPGLDVGVASLALAAMVGQFAYITVSTHAELDVERAARTLTTIWARGIGLAVDWGQPE